jgi:hypothetical protein
MLLSLREAQYGEPLQLVLGADKRNPLVRVYHSREPKGREPKGSVQFSLFLIVSMVQKKRGIP